MIGVIFLTRRRILLKALEPYGMTLKQYSLLGYIRRRGPITPSEAAELLFCDRPTASVILANCRRKGWLGRERSSGDGRSYAITLLPAGEAAYEEARSRGAIRRADIDPLDVLGPAERARFVESLGKVYERALELGSGR